MLYFPYSCEASEHPSIDYLSTTGVTLSLQFEEQQAFERSRRFLRQLEISFGDNPSHYQKIIKALQTGPDLSPTSIHEVQLVQSPI